MISLSQAQTSFRLKKVFKFFKYKEILPIPCFICTSFLNGLRRETSVEGIGWCNAKCTPQPKTRLWSSHEKVSLEKLVLNLNFVHFCIFVLRYTSQNILRKDYKKCTSEKTLLNISCGLIIK